MNKRFQVFLEDAYKGYTLDQDKIISPDQTVRRFRKKLAEIDLDILAETVRIDNGRLGIPVYFSVCGKDAHEVIGTKKQMGKGATPEQSEASAVMELAERYSFFSFCRDPNNFLVKTYRDLNEQAISLDLIAQSVHDESREAAQALDIFTTIPLNWVWAYNLTRKESVLVPFNWFFAINEFNGPSAGNCREEAILQGICEIVERHVSSLVSRNRLAVNGLNLDSAADPSVVDMLGKYRRISIRLFASDFTLDTGIPSVGVMAYDPSTFPARSEIVWTAGTTPDPQKALSRALTEVAQLAGDFNSSSNYVASGLPKPKNLSEAQFIMNPPKVMDIRSLPDLSNQNIRMEVENCIQALARIGMEVFLVDVTHPRLGIPAYYTIIPGAHFRERAAGTSVGLFTAKLISESKDPRWAAEMLEKLDKRLPGQYYTKFFLGTTFLALDAPERALALFEEAMTLGPKAEDIPSIFFYMGLCLKEGERYKEAIAALEKAISADPERPEVYNLMGFCFFKLREHKKAIDCFKKVLQLNPGSGIDYANIASNYREMGEVEKAIRYYRFALELDPTIEFARENLKRLEERLKRGETA
jgi:ribosomal protein S12 methylthiotransferase accessory factor